MMITSDSTEYATTPEAAQARHDNMQHKAHREDRGRQGQGADSWEDCDVYACQAAQANMGRDQVCPNCRGTGRVKSRP